MYREVCQIEAIDQHAHNVTKQVLAPPFEAAFSESTDPLVWTRDVEHTVFYQRSLEQLGEFYQCSPEAVKATRAELSLEERTQRCLEAAKLKGLLLDDGLSPAKIQPWQWHQQFVPTKRLLRIEHLAQELMLEHQRFEPFEEAYRATLADLPEEVVGLKCIAAYRGGLAVEATTRAQAARVYSSWREKPLAASPLYSHLIELALEEASRRAMAVQFHTGFGDPDLALELSNPLLLRPLIERHKCPFVLLHAGYPFFRETGFLASVYANVWTDFGLAVPFLSRSGMRVALAGLLELAPLNKVMYSSDASLIPELYYLGALNGRRVLSEVLAGSVDDGDLTAAQASRGAEMILAGNAQKLYGL